MRAAAMAQFDAPPEMIDVDIPEPETGEVRVRVHAASVNGFDLAVARGFIKGMMEHRFPLTLGKDFAGTIDAVGPDAGRYQVGDRVFGVVTKPYLGDGSFAEYVTVPVTVGLAPLPDTIDFAEGGTIGLAGATAIAAVDAADPRPSTTILVVGATGGVGNQAVQLAAAAGATVIATAHGQEKERLVTELGAAEVVDYAGDVTSSVLARHPEGVDALLHLAGDPRALLPAVRRGGRFVSALVFSPDQLPTEEAELVPIIANPDEPMLDRVARNQAQGRTRVTVEHTYRLDEAPAALAHFARGKMGKLAIKAD